MAESGSIVLVDERGQWPPRLVAAPACTWWCGHGARALATWPSSPAAEPARRGRPRASRLRRTPSSSPAPPAPGEPDGPESCSWSCSTTAAPTSGRRRATRCWPASAAAPASTPARSTARSGATPTAGSTRGPIGAVLTPLLAGTSARRGRGSPSPRRSAARACEACPVGIPLHDLLLAPAARQRAAVGTQQPPGGGLGPGVGSARRVPGSVRQAAPPARWSAPPPASRGCAPTRPVARCRSPPPRPRRDGDV